MIKKIISILMALAINAGSFAGVPSHTVFGAESSGSGSGSLQTSTITIDAGKVTVRGKTSLGEGKNITIKITDPDQNIDYIGQTSSGTNGEFYFEFTPNVWMEGDFTAQIGGDGIENPYVSTFKLASGPQNTAPVLASIGNRTIAVNRTLAFTLSATDADGDSLTYSASGLPEGAAFDAVIRSFTWTPNDEQPGEYNVVFTVSDGKASDSETVKITVNEATMPQEITEVRYEVDSNAKKVSISGTVKSRDGGEVTILVKNPGGSVDYVGQASSGSSGSFSFVYVLDEWIEGTYSVRIGGDGINTPYEGSFNIGSEPQNSAPVLESIGNKSVNEGLLLTFTIRATDADEDSLTYSASNLPASAAFDPATGEFSWTPNYTQSGTYSVTFTATDSKGASDSETITITVNDVSAGGGGSGGSGGGSSGSGNSRPNVPQPQTQPAPTPVTFTDIAGVPWAKEAIEALAAQGVINGMGNGTFKPDDKVTRAQFIKILMLAFKLTEQDASCSFTDVKKGEWHYDSIAAAQKLGIVKGKADGSFGVNDEITRQDMAVMVHRAAQKFGVSLNEAGNPQQFSDRSEIAAYAQEAIASMQKAGIINGTGNGRFEPKGNATRAQAAVIIYKLFTRIGIN